MIEPSGPYPELFGESVLVIYDLSDPSQRAAASEEPRAWGRERTTIHALDNDHVTLAFRAGFIVLDVDQEPPPSSPETTYSVARLPGGAERTPMPNWRRW